MKFRINPHDRESRRALLPGQGARKSRQSIFGVVLLCASMAVAANVLVNPGFEANSGNNVPTGWTYFMPPTGTGKNYWVESQGGRAHSGTFYWKQWGIFWDPTRTNVGGIYQTFNSAAGSVYEASGWFYTLTSDQMGANNYAWIDVSFLDEGGNLLGLYKSDDFSTAVGTDAWFFYAVTNACDVTAPVATGDPSFTRYAVTGAVTQLTAPLGTKSVRYRYAHVQGGSSGGACYFDDAVLNQVSGALPPVISNVSPLNMIQANPGDGLTFTANSPSGTAINTNAIKVVVNGVDVSGSLLMTGTASNRNVAFYGLQSNLTYTVSLVVTDAFGATASAETYFETMWVGTPPVSFLWEAEDFDFDGGHYLNNPELCGVSGNPNCYFGKVGVQDIDENSISSDGDHLYRPDDPMATTGSGDFLRKNLAAAGRNDYKVGWFPPGEWVNYTRDWPSGTFWVVGRLANGGGSGTLIFSRIDTNATVTDLGTFRLENGRGWNTYDYVFLRDTNGNLANVTLGGKETYRITTGGNADMGVFMLVEAQPDIPVLSKVFPSGSRPFGATNAFGFTATSQGGSISSTNIRVILNGVDVSSNLQVGGPASVRTVVYPSLSPNTTYTASLTVTNDNGAGIAETVVFDTFTEDNLIVQAEDFDYEGGKYINNPDPLAYQLVPDAVAEIDYHHTPVDNERLFYRFAGIPSEITADYNLKKFTDIGATDYNIGWFPNGDWANYTRNYPQGQFRVYGRIAGSGGYSLYLDKVVSGVGTTNQVAQRLGRFGAVGRDWQLWDWVPLMTDDLSAPVTISLGGVETLRLSTTGNANVNYLMFVPVVQITATLTNGQVLLSFPTQQGGSYQVLATDELVTGTWFVRTNVTGTGSQAVIRDNVEGSRRFYRVTSE